MINGRNGLGGRLVLLFIIAGALVSYGLFRAEPFPVYFDSSDKVGHFVMFCVLVFVARGVLIGRVHFALILIPLLGLAVGSELAQASDWLPARHYSIGDLGANVGGFFVGLGLSVWLSGNRVCNQT